MLNRLRHDGRYSLDDFLIGYSDRHEGVQEKGAGSWVTESTSEDFIPQHKILYFSKKGEKVWDRKERIDLVFGVR